MVIDGLVNFDALAATPAQTRPFPHLHATGLLSRSAVQHLNQQFPDLPVSGLLPANTLKLSPALSQLADELRGPRMAEILSEKFDIELTGLPTMLTVRARAAARDGRIHTDSESKIVTLLLYLNETWSDEGGRLRLLNSGADVEDYFAEVVPEAGTLVAFRRTDNSWHGHHPFVGPRRYLMVNWMRDGAVARFEQGRHRVAAVLKGVFS